MCSNIGTPNNHHFPFETNGKVVLGVPILKHFRVFNPFAFRTAKTHRVLAILSSKGLRHAFLSSDSLCFLFFCLQKFGPDTAGGGRGTARVMRDELQELEQQNTDLKQDVRDLQQELAAERRTAEKVHIIYFPQRAFGAKMTLYLRRCDVITLH